MTDNQITLLNTEFIAVGILYVFTVSNLELCFQTLIYPNTTLKYTDDVGKSI